MTAPAQDEMRERLHLRELLQEWFRGPHPNNEDALAHVLELRFMRAIAPLRAERDKLAADLKRLDSLCAEWSQQNLRIVKRCTEAEAALAQANAEREATNNRVQKLWHERRQILVERDRAVAALDGLFAGGFIEEGAREHSQWAQELNARLEPCRIILISSTSPSDALGGWLFAAVLAFRVVIVVGHADELEDIAGRAIDLASQASRAALEADKRGT